MKWIVIVIVLLAISGFGMFATDNVVDQEPQARICQEVNRSCENFRKLDIIHTVNAMECNRFQN